jgi:hypothetical protein
MSYWQKRDLAKEEIARGLRQHLLDQFKGVPVIVLRNKADDIRLGNKAWVKDLLKGLDCDDFNFSWRIFFDFRDDEEGMARVSDFTIIVEGT